METRTMIRAARLASDFTQAELAERSATSQATLSAYESGQKVPSAATLQRILAAAGHGLVSVGGRRPVVTPSRAVHRQVARSLHDVLELAAALPSRPERRLRYPRLDAARP